MKLSELQLAIIHNLNYYIHISNIYIKLTPHNDIVPNNGLFTLNGQSENEISIYAGNAPGGAWYHVGILTVNNTSVAVSTKNIRAVLYRKSVPDDIRTFYYCDPEFPGNTIDFINLVAIDHMKAIKLATDRFWKRNLANEC